MVLLSTLGGLALFGINGFVVGPLIAVLFIAFWQIFGREFRAESNEEQSDSSEPHPGTQTPAEDARENT